MAVKLPATRSLIPYLALAAGVLALSLSGIFVHWSSAPGVVTSFYRMLLASVVLLPVAVWRLRKFGLPPRRLLVFPLLGGLFTALDQGLWSTSIGYTSIANATLLNNIAPLWVTLFAAFVWHERMNARFWSGLAMTLVGAAVVLGSDLIRAPHLGIGDGIALFSSLFWAGYYLVTQRGRVFFDTLIYLWGVVLVTALLLGPSALALGMPLGGFDGNTWLAILGAGLISQVAGHFLLAYALGHLPASTVSPTMVSQPVFTALLAIPLAGQLLSSGQWLGGLSVVVGIWLVTTSRGPKQRFQAASELTAVK
jgi:drug/metabolite transporter (DMT)-like permease